jgi:hypothetical protein
LLFYIFYAIISKNAKGLKLLSAQREIRILDANQNELFQIPDGGYIILTQYGFDYRLRCRVIEGDMFQVDRMIFVESEFAEKMAALNTTFAPG